jgi:hypothetical protein
MSPVWISEIEPINYFLGRAGTECPKEVSEKERIELRGTDFLLGRKEVVLTDIGRTHKYRYNIQGAITTTYCQQLQRIAGFRSCFFLYIPSAKAR